MFRAKRSTVFTLLMILMSAAAASAQLTIPGEVVDVIDGKTVIVAIPGSKVKVVLQYIEVPEQGQPLSDTVTEHLRSLVIGKSVEYRPKTFLKDRAIGRLTIKNIDLSQQMLRDGAAWHRPIKGSGQEKAEYDLYASTEAAAKQEKIGVWSIPDLKPMWERRVENEDNVGQKERYSFAMESSPETSPSRSSSMPTGANPSLANVGALTNGFDPITGNGYLGTSFLDVTEIDKSAPYRTSIDISYYYKQDAQNRRKGTFVVSVLSISQKWRFLERNNLVITGNGKDIIIGKAKRMATNDGDDFSEKLVYAVDRSTLERIVNDNEAKVKIGNYLIQPAPGLKYLLYNLLQVTQ